MASDLPFQYDIYNEYGIDRTSLSTLREVIHALKFGDDPDTDIAKILAGTVRDRAEIASFVNTIFRRATAGFVQLRMFIDGERKGPLGFPWEAVPVTEHEALIDTVVKKASAAALSLEKVNFCPPVCTFVGPDKARIGDKSRVLR